MVCQWHLGHSRSNFLPTHRGFDEFFGFYHAMGDHFSHSFKGAYDMWHEPRPNCGGDMSCAQIVDERGNYSSFVFAREAVRVVENHAKGLAAAREAGDEEQPLFLYLSYAAPHGPWQVPPKYKLPEYFAAKWTKQRVKYAGMVTAADESLGHVIDALKRVKMWDDTLVVFTSDNGASKNGGGSNLPHKGFKCDAYEGGVISDGSKCSCACYCVVALSRCGSVDY